ncbi:MAG: 3-deoxy-manno-octulosonate cytidylyltransferase [Acetobacteraceae bacterium]
MTPIVIIPARLASSRLPGKPLADIAGLPMIVWVMRRAEAANVGPVAVACGEAEIAAAVRAAGGHAVLTDPDLPSGSDRVQQALAILDPDGRHDVILNLQGDVPTVDPTVIRAALLPLVESRFDIGTVVVPIADATEAVTPSFVKAACAFGPGAAVAAVHYFSRAPIPWGEGPRWHHIGIYAYHRAALARFVALPQSPLERREGLEQLRALEAGMHIGCARVAHGPFGVDTPADLQRARGILAAAPGGNSGVNTCADKGSP